MIVIESPLGGGSCRLIRDKEAARRSLPPQINRLWAQCTRRREVVCGVNKVRRADTVQIFSAFGIEMVELPLTASVLARTEEKRKHEARRAYAKRKRSLPPQINTFLYTTHQAVSSQLLLVIFKRYGYRTWEVK